MAAWPSPQRLLKIGISLLLGATGIALFFVFFQEFVGGIASLLVVAFPLSVLAGFVGLVLTIVGAGDWAFQTSSRKVTFFGIVLVAAGMLSFLAVDQIRFGFDDPTIVFAIVITGAPLVIGALFLLTAVIRRLRSATKPSR